MPSLPRTPALLALIAAAFVAALFVAAPIVMGGGDLRSSRNLAAAEPSAWSAAHAHADTRQNAAADRRQLARCAGTAYRRAHAARCPSARAFLAGASRQLAAETGNPAADGRWGAPFPVPTWGIHAVLLPTGKVLWMGKAQSEDAGGAAFLYDPATGTTRDVAPPDVRYLDGSVKPANLFCSGHALLADGRVLVAGGNLAYYKSNAPGQSWKGSKWLFTFNPWNETWTKQSASMAKGRWYPTVTTLPDGRALISGGWDESGNDISDDDLEVFTPSAAIDGANGGLVKVGTRPWSQVYPHMFVIPDTTVAGAGSPKVLLAGPAGRYPANAAILDTATWTWSSIPFMPTNREFGSAVLLPGGPGGSTKVLLPGGSDMPVNPTPTRTSVVLDLNNPQAGFQPGPSLVTGRTHANTVLLPDESVLAVGGGVGTSAPGTTGIYTGPVYQSEILSPGAGAFRGVDTQQEARTYHATALLLPDGRVLSSGDDRSSHYSGDARNAEIYAPPYLFRGPRPEITFAPQAARYDARIRVGTPNPDGIAKAVLMRPSSVTHVTDMDQRSIELTLTSEGGGLSLQTPRNATLAPPGYYMLFLLDADGVPSTARWVRLDPSAPDAPEIPSGSLSSVGRGAGPGPGPGTAPPGGTPGPGGSSAPKTGRDTSAPVLKVNTVTLPRVRGPIRLRVVLRSSEASAVLVRLRIGSHVIDRTLSLKAGKRSIVRIRVNRGPLHGKLHLGVRARDPKGNTGRVARAVRF